MSRDYTLAVDELRRHYVELTVLKKTVRAQVKAEYEAKIDFEIQRRIEAEEIKFANHLAAVKEREGMPVTIIQDHVLRTRTWNRWEKWRDMAGLAPELVTAESAREAKRLANAVGVWSEDYSTLTVSKNTRGEVLETPVVYDSKTLYRVHSNWWAYAVEQANDVDDVRARKADPALAAALTAEFQRAIDEGHIENPDLRKN